MRCRIGAEKYGHELIKGHGVTTVISFERKSGLASDSQSEDPIGHNVHNNLLGEGLASCLHRLLSLILDGPCAGRRQAWRALRSSVSWWKVVFEQRSDLIKGRVCSLIRKNQGLRFSCKEASYPSSGFKANVPPVLLFGMCFFEEENTNNYSPEEDDGAYQVR